MGGKLKDDRRRVTVILKDTTYEALKKMACRDPDPTCSVSSICRNYIEQGLNGKLTEENLEFVAPIIREILEDVVSYHTKNLSMMTSKACIQSGAAAYLCAETISKFVPEVLQEDYNDSYIAARKKAVQYMKGKISDQE